MKGNALSASRFAPLLESYFLKYMISQKASSPRTIASYRDSFTLYIKYLSERHGIDPEKIEMDCLSLDYLLGFATYLENERECCASTINLRMATMKSFLRYALVEAPEYADTIRKALSMPCRKINHPVMTFISKKEYEALLGACNGQSLIYLRDKLMIMVLYNTGCRVSELVNVRVCDITFANGKSETSYIHFYGKGRKERTTPIWRSTEAYIRQYVALLEMPKTAFLLNGKRGEHITRSGIAQRITTISSSASEDCPSLKEKTITPHTFRHSAAMNLLQAGVDISTIAIWLGHESIETTHKYMVADLEAKRKAMEKLAETTDGTFNYKPSKSILAFLNSL